jgi:RNA polymerase sigma factor (sigma-70 family)
VRRKLPAAQANIFAEEFVADVHLELWEMIEAGKPVLNVKPLLGTIVRRRIIDAFRRRAGVAVDPIEETLQDDKALEDMDAIDTLDANDGIINTILDALPADERRVLSMRYLDRLSVMETAARLGLTEDQIKKRCQKALQLARRIAIERGLYDDMA